MLLHPNGPEMLASVYSVPASSYGSKKPEWHLASGLPSNPYETARWWHSSGCIAATSNGVWVWEGDLIVRSAGWRLAPMPHGLFNLFPIDELAPSGIELELEAGSPEVSIRPSGCYTDNFTKITVSEMTSMLTAHMWSRPLSRQAKDLVPISLGEDTALELLNGLPIMCQDVASVTARWSGQPHKRVTP